MNVFFTGIPTKSEILLFLKNQPNSLINKPELQKSLCKNQIAQETLILNEKTNQTKPTKPVNYLKTLLKNTKKNSGYKNIKIVYKNKVNFNFENKKPLNRKVSFSEICINKPHNLDGNVKSILKSTKQIVNREEKKQKRKVFVECLREDSAGFDFQIIE